MMSSGCPLMHRALVIGDDAQLLAQISSVLARKNSYLPILDGPRIQRPDADAEVIRRNNAAARVAPSAIFFAGLTNTTCDEFKSYFPSERCFLISNVDELRKAQHGQVMRSRKVLTWGKDRIGIGLLNALRTKREIEFTDSNSSEGMISSDSGHLVVCEEGDELAQVIAANYAYAIDAGLCLVPFVSEEDAERIRETFYGLYDDRENSPTSLLEQLRAELRQRAAAIPEKQYRMITFISKELPWGFAFSEVPSSHLFIYPDLGISLINGIAAEQSNAPGIRVAAVIDPKAVDAPEIELAAKCLAERSVLVRGYRGANATVSEISRMIELLPYDFLLIATHCGDADGWRWTYEFVDSEGIERKLIVDVAIGVSHVPGREKLEVMQFTKFVSLDGVDWADPEKKKKLNVGNAIKDYLARAEQLEPVKRESIGRVRWSAALKMFDNNLILAPRALADNGSPIVLNNACASWHRLAGTFAFCNARAYIGTLFSVSNAEAQDVAMNILDRHFGKSLALALWHAQNAVYQDSIRRPYLLVGTHFQRLRTKVQDKPKYLLERLSLSEQYWSKRAGRTEPSDVSNTLTFDDYVRFLNGEIEGLRRHFYGADKGSTDKGSQQIRGQIFILDTRPPPPSRNIGDAHDFMHFLPKR
jgi:hypothetical protein